MNPSDKIDLVDVTGLFDNVTADTLQNMKGLWHGVVPKYGAIYIPPGFVFVYNGSQGLHGLRSTVLPSTISPETLSTLCFPWLKLLEQGDRGRESIAVKALLSCLQTVAAAAALPPPPPPERSAAAAVDQAADPPPMPPPPTVAAAGVEAAPPQGSAAAAAGTPTAMPADVADGATPVTKRAASESAVCSKDASKAKKNKKD